MDDLFFWVAKIGWLLISPSNLFFTWFFVGLTLLWVNKRQWAKRVLTSLMSLVMVAAVLPLGQWLVVPLETRYRANPPITKVDGIIVLAGSENGPLTYAWDQVVTGDTAERSLAFMELARKFPHANLVFSGGSGNPFSQDLKQADVAKRLFAEQGLNVSKIFFERESRNTFENASFTKRFIEPKEGETWVLITTGWHMPRAVGSFCRVGWDVIPYPVDYRTDGKSNFRIGWGLSLELISIGMKEWVGTFAYRLSGRSC